MHPKISYAITKRRSRCHTLRDRAGFALDAELAGAWPYLVVASFTTCPKPSRENRPREGGARAAKAIDAKKKQCSAPLARQQDGTFQPSW